MLAYCDRENGDIHFSDKKPRNALLIAEHPDRDRLQEAVKQSGAHYQTTWRGEKRIGQNLSVPWFFAAKYPDEEDERVEIFAQKVRHYLEG